MSPITLFQSAGFGIPEPEITIGLLSQANIVDIPCRDFGKPYTDVDEKIAGNIFKWLRTGYKVLSKVHEIENRVVVFTNVCDKLSERLAVQLETSCVDTSQACIDLVRSFALADYIIEKVVFEMEGNWLLKKRNPVHSGLLKYFQYWLVHLDLRENQNGGICLKLFKSTFAAEIELEHTANYTDHEVISAFISCFFRGVNEVDVFFNTLQKLKEPYIQ
jgi:hypothetical protein